MNRITGDVLILMLVKPNGERFIFSYDHETRSDCLRTIGRFASNPELSFSWYDAAVLSKRIRDEAIAVRDETERRAAGVNTEANPNLSLGYVVSPFKCDNCGASFVVGGGGGSVGYAYVVSFCPFCGDDDIEEAECSGT